MASKKKTCNTSVDTTSSELTSASESKDRRLQSEKSEGECASTDGGSDISSIWMEEDTDCEGVHPIFKLFPLQIHIANLPANVNFQPHYSLSAKHAVAHTPSKVLDALEYRRQRLQRELEIVRCAISEIHAETDFCRDGQVAIMLLQQPDIKNLQASPSASETDSVFTENPLEDSLGD